MNWEEWATTHQTRHHAKLEEWAIEKLRTFRPIDIVKGTGVSRTRLYYILNGSECRQKTKVKLMEFLERKENQ